MGNTVQKQFQAAVPQPAAKCQSDLVQLNSAQKNVEQAQNNFRLAQQDLSLKQSVAAKCDPRVAAIAPVRMQDDQCAVKQVEYNQLQADVARKAGEIERCNPESTNQRKLAAAQQEYNNFKTAKQAELNQSINEFQVARDRLQKIIDAIKPTENYLRELEGQDKGEQAKLTDLEQNARRERRKFLDGGPQDGTPGLVPGVRTSDDKVVLAFWICYGAAFAAGMVLLLKYLGPRVGVTSWPTALRILVPATLLAYAAAYYAISTYA